MSLNSLHGHRAPFVSETCEVLDGMPIPPRGHKETHERLFGRFSTQKNQGPNGNAYHKYVSFLKQYSVIIASFNVILNKEQQFCDHMNVRKKNGNAPERCRSLPYYIDGAESSACHLSLNLLRHQCFRSSSIRFCRSAGLIPGIALACANVPGLSRSNFCRASIDKVRIAA